MKATLVGTVGDRRLYYIIDAGPDENDGALVTAAGKVMEFNFFSFVNKTTGINKIMKSPFHNLLWAPPSESNKKEWVNTFLLKKNKIDDKIIDGLPVMTSLDTKK
jgi:hypothetical protein